VGFPVEEPLWKPALPASCKQPRLIRLLYYRAPMPNTSMKKIERLLKRALIYDGEMHYRLYEYELEERLDDLNWKKTMTTISFR
jgi:hypothetical protein